MADGRARQALGQARLTPVVLHALFELLAYAAGFKLFLFLQRKEPHPQLAQPTVRLSILAGMILAAALGSKLAYWIDDPLGAFAGFPDLHALLAGKSIVGGLLGGLIGVELVKSRVGVTQSTGDAFVFPLILGMCIGRVGCHLAGVDDHTAGLPTTLPWAIDYGDGVPRHPTALYEIAFLLALGAVLARARFPRSGDRFRAFMVGYLAFRFAIEFLKPLPYSYAGLSGLQWLCVAGLAHYHRFLWRTS